MQGQWRGDVPPYITSNFLSYTRHTRGRGFDPRQCLKLIRNSNLLLSELIVTNLATSLSNFDKNCSIAKIETFVHCFRLDLTCSSSLTPSTLQRIQTLMLLVKLRTWTSCPLWSASMASSGEKVISSGVHLPRTPSRCEKNPAMNTTLRCGNVQSIVIV